MANSSLAVDAAMLLAARGIGTTGVTLFTGWLPGTPDNCITLEDVAGGKGEYTMGASETAPVFERLNLVIRVRNATYQNAWNKAMEVHAVLRNFRGVMNGTTYALVQERYSPTFLGRDENNRSVFSLNYTALRNP